MNTFCGCVVLVSVISCITFGIIVGGSSHVFTTPSAGVQQVQPLEAQGVLSTPFPEEPTKSTTSELVIFGSVGIIASAALLSRTIASRRGVAPTRKSVVAVSAFESELGVQEPVGFWDPLGLSADGDLATFKRRRTAEIKHGRVCMIACIGYIVPEYFKWPGYLSPALDIKFADVPNGLAALSKVPATGWMQIVAFAGITEGSWGFDKNSGTGDYGWKVITSDDPEVKTKKLAAEIANGRLAMVAIIGMFFQDGLTGAAWGDWALYTASPLRAADAEEAPPPPPPFDPSKQIGAMAPLGFFDPAGFSKVGDEEGFRNLRAAELKHGRVAMMAALGGVAQHYIKFPGFEKVPAGMAAVTSPPGTYGFAALFLVAGALETAVWTQDPSKEVGDFGDPLGLGQYDEDMRNKEINNGRFAMFAALGIVSADLLTGKDAIQQFGL